MLHVWLLKCVFVCVCVAGPLVSAAEASGGSSKKVYLVLVVSAFFFFGIDINVYFYTMPM